MQTYSILREIADSWVLIALFSFFVGTILWAFRPGSRAVHDDISTIPLRDDVPGTSEQRTAAGGKTLHPEGARNG